MCARVVVCVKHRMQIQRMSIHEQARGMPSCKLQILTRQFACNPFSVYLPVCLSVCLCPVFLPVFPSACLPACLPACLFVCLSSRKCVSFFWNHSCACVCVSFMTATCMVSVGRVYEHKPWTHECAPSSETVRDGQDSRCFHW